MELPEVTEAKRLTLRPGDLVVLRFPDVLDLQQVEDVQAAMRDAFGDLGWKPKVIVLDGGADIEVIGPEAGSGTAGPMKVSLDFNDGGEEFIHWLQEFIRRRGGGSVQSVLGGP